MKETLSIFILFVFCFSNSTCRKITKKHVEYIGDWETQQVYYPCKTYININYNSKGMYGSSGNVDGCGHNWNGTAKIIGDHLYIGLVKLKILQEPIYKEDSLFNLPGSYYKTKVYASMKVKTTKLHSSATYELFKVK